MGNSSASVGQFLDFVRQACNDVSLLEGPMLDNRTVRRESGMTVRY